MIVIDASIATKLFLPEPDSEQAEAILTNEDNPIAPELLRVEVYAALTKAYRTNRIDAETAKLQCHSWDMLLQQGAIALAPDEIDIHHAVALSIDLNHPVQDCLYLAVAIRTDSPLATSDKKLTQKADLCGVKVMEF